MKLKLTLLGVGAIAAALFFFARRPAIEETSLAPGEAVPREPSAAALPTARPAEPQKVTPAQAAVQKFRARRSRAPVWREKLGPYIGGRPVEISGQPFYPVNGVRAFSLRGNSAAEGEIARIPGFSLREDEGSAGGKIILYDAQTDSLFVASGQLTLSVTDGTTRSRVEEGLGLKVTGEEPSLNLLFLDTGAKSLEQLTAYLAAAKALPGVESAQLDLLGRRAVAQ